MVAAAEQTGVADAVTVLRRDATAVYRNERAPQGHWAHPAGAAAALLIEQSRPYTAAEAARFWATHRRLRTAMPHYRDALATIAERARPLKDLDGWTLHRLRHSALTHDAEGCTSTPMLPACSRHAPVRSLEWYARPGVDAVARHVAEREAAEAGADMSFRLLWGGVIYPTPSGKPHLPRNIGRGGRWKSHRRVINVPGQSLKAPDWQRSC